MSARVIRNQQGASAVEFAIVLPLLLIFLFGIIDGGRLLWDLNRLQKATQYGARMAVVTDVVEGGLSGTTYVGVNVGGVILTQGDRIPASAFGEVTCNDTACTCTVTPCPTAGTYNDTAFDRIVNRMKLMKADVDYGNVEVVYRSSGLGFAGDPNGMDLSPLVTVRVRADNRLRFRPLTTPWTSFDLPALATTLTAEDSAGTASN